MCLLRPGQLSSSSRLRTSPALSLCCPETRGPSKRPSASRSRAAPVRPPCSPSASACRRRRRRPILSSALPRWRSWQDGTTCVRHSGRCGRRGETVWPARARESRSGTVHSTAYENIVFAELAFDARATLEERALELLALVGLKEKADHLPAELSGGEAQ